MLQCAINGKFFFLNLTKVGQKKGISKGSPNMASFKCKKKVLQNTARSKSSEIILNCKRRLYWPTTLSSPRLAHTC